MVPRGQQIATPPSPLFGGTLGVITIAFGIGVLGAYAFDWHAHTCDCGNRWRHLGAFNVGDERAHTCSVCGQVQWWQDGVPRWLREAHPSPAPQLALAPRFQAAPR